MTLAPTQTIYLASFNTADVQQNIWRPKNDDRRIIGPPEQEFESDEYPLVDRSVLQAVRGMRVRLPVVVESIGYTSVQAYSGYDALTTVLADMVNANWYLKVTYITSGGYNDFKCYLEPGHKITKIHNKQIGARFEATIVFSALRSSFQAIYGTWL